MVDKSLDHFIVSNSNLDHNNQSFLPPDVDGALHLTLERNFFYKFIYRSLLKLILILLIIILSLTGLIFYLKSTQVGPQYVATTTLGTPVKLVSTMRPNMTHNELRRWANQAAIDSYTFNFSNYRSALQSVRKHYTAIGYQKYIKALQDSRNMEAVKAEKYVVSAQTVTPPQILKEYKPQKSGERYSWLVKIPMLLTYESVNKTRQQKVTMLMLIVRLPTLESEDGVGIAQVIISEGHNDLELGNKI